MTSPQTNNGSHALAQTSTGTDRLIGPDHQKVFSWRRVLIVLGCTLSVIWLTMLHISTANSGGFTHVTTRGKVTIIIGTVLSAFPMCFLRGRVKYVLATPFLLFAALTLWACFSSWGWL
jgi:hypothetical protein